MIKGLHHNAYRCRDSEQTREFYEDFLGLPLQLAFDIKQTITGRVSKVLHSFYQMAGARCPFDFKQQRDFDLHIALEVEHDQLLEMMQKGEEAGIETRGISDHDFVQSIYFRDPNGYVIELTAKTNSHNSTTFNSANAHNALAQWQITKGN